MAPKLHEIRKAGGKYYIYEFSSSDKMIWHDLEKFHCGKSRRQVSKVIISIEKN